MKLLESFQLQSLKLTFNDSRIRVSTANITFQTEVLQI